MRMREISKRKLNVTENIEVSLRFKTIDLKISQISEYAKKYFESHNIEQSHGKFISNIKRFSKINESKETKDIESFIKLIQKVDSTKTIKVGDQFAVLEFEIIFAYKEINGRGFTEPKEVAAIKLHTDGTINYIQFTDGDRYPRLTPARYEGKPISYSAYFSDKNSADRALTALTLAVPNGWDLDASDIKHDVTEVIDSNLNELSTKKLAQYKQAAGADASAADKRGDFEHGNKRFKGIIKATLKQFDQTTKPKKGLEEDKTLDENLHQWFKEKWVRFNPQGKIMGDCARGDDSEGKPKCLPQAKAHALGKKGRASAASRKRREDPNPERSGKAINVATKKKSNENVAEGSGEHIDEGIRDFISTSKDKFLRLKDALSDEWAQSKEMWRIVKKGSLANAREINFANKQFKDILKLVGLTGWYSLPIPGNTLLILATEHLLNKVGMSIIPDKIRNQVLTTNKKDVAEDSYKRMKCPECGGEMISEDLLNEKKDACYYKVKSRYKVWPSAYASGALVKCRKRGAKNWGNKGGK